MTHIDKAIKYFEQRYHCSQAVLAAFAEEMGLTEQQALKLGGCFGAGMCKGEVCGACTGALMALGMKFGQFEITDMESRTKTNEVTEAFLDSFRIENGSYICKELVKCDLSTESGRRYAIEHNIFTELCPQMVYSAVRIAEQLMNE